MSHTRYRKGRIHAAEMACYTQGKNMIEISQELGVDKSTVSRTIKRGEARLRRCLRYGAKQFLVDDGDAAY